MARQPVSDVTLDGHRKGRVPRAVREQQLPDVAEELFLSQGYEATSIEDIARAAGVSRPIVYEHHGNKGGVYLACVRRARAALERAIADAAASAGEPREQLLRGADAYFQVLERDPRRWELLFGKTGVVGELGAELARERQRTVETIADLLAAWASESDRERLLAYANMISGAGEQLGRWWLANRQIPRATISRLHAEFSWSGASELLPSGSTAADGTASGGTA
jgi:AcrR family transcriptional regulator